ncbi:VOC family protein [Jatrophihabitans sp.]|uniref:VOC family protein n=1 Tax=Jatrophihabitans sp. TaxID=1932789 RepID=UPI0030C77E5E|nr:glyoxalase/bleomycin resistance protein/dioxygenase [Jatrophihabitans sp.]
MYSSRYFAHVNINTADYDRAEQFYADVLGLSSLGPTSANRPQDGTPFGLAGQELGWRGGFLADERGLKGPVLDILEWTAPATAPSPAEEDGAPGLRAVGFAVASLETVTAALESYQRPVQRARLTVGEAVTEIVLSTDLDGTRLELREAQPAPRYEYNRLLTRDLAASRAFYGDVLHLICEPPQAYRVEVDGAVLESGTTVRAYLDGQSAKFWLNLTQPDDPAAMPVSSRKGNTAGLFRMALLSDDIDASYADLVKGLPSAQPPVDVHVGAEYVPVKALFFQDPDGTVVEYLVGMWAS